VIRLILNILWFVFGGWISALAWIVAGLILAITVVGAAYTPAAFRIAGFSAWPFGKHIVRREAMGQEDLGTGPFGCGLNVVWFVLAGWWLALHHIVIAAAQAVTIIGIPFAWQHVKLALISLAPVGTDVVEAP
jgi:uncharacterized membrane protein YccF (DUF307 family)